MAICTNKTIPQSLRDSSLYTREPKRIFCYQNGYIFVVNVTLKPPLCKWEKICKQIGTACRDGGIVFVSFAIAVALLYTLKEYTPTDRKICRGFVFFDA